MRILIDINHPAHVHYFKNFVWEMQKRGHDVLVTASTKDITKQLLEIYKLPYVISGNYAKGSIKKVLHLFAIDLAVLKIARNFNPDVFIGFGSIQSTHVSFLLGKKSIILDDTEHAKHGQALYRPFTDIIMTPACFKKDFGRKQLRFNGTTDLLYLHPNRFTPNNAVLKELKLTEGDTFFIVRFVSWDADHDTGQSGIKDREDFVHELAKHGRVFITSESELPESLKQYQARVSPEKMHDLMYYATMFVGESGTMATEAACLGTHAIIVNSEVVDEDGVFVCGVFEFYNKYGMLFAYRDDSEVMMKIQELLQIDELRKIGKDTRDVIVRENGDVTQSLVDLVEGVISK